jgi:large subunit ribosomal protein L18e
MAGSKAKIKEISKTKIERAMQRKTNSGLKELILFLKKKKGKEYNYLAYLLSRPTRKQASVNLFKINKFSKDKDSVVVPGKVLSDGEMQHKITIAAVSFSEKAQEKLKKEGCEIKTIKDLTSKDAKFKIII